MWGDVGRCREMSGDIGRCGEIWSYSPHLDAPGLAARRPALCRRRRRGRPPGGPVVGGRHQDTEPAPPRVVKSGAPPAGLLVLLRHRACVPPAPLRPALEPVLEAGSRLQLGRGSVACGRRGGDGCAPHRLAAPPPLACLACTRRCRGRSSDRPASLPPLPATLSARILPVARPLRRRRVRLPVAPPHLSCPRAGLSCPRARPCCLCCPRALAECRSPAHTPPPTPLRRLRAGGLRRPATAARSAAQPPVLPPRARYRLGVAGLASKRVDSSRS